MENLPENEKETRKEQIRDINNLLGNAFRPFSLQEISDGLLDGDYTDCDVIDFLYILCRKYQNALQEIAFPTMGQRDYPENIAREALGL